MGTGFRIGVAFNMMICALLPGALPRETLCGMLGRWSLEGRPWQAYIAFQAVPVLDTVFHRRIEDCVDIACMEAEARDALYPKC